MCFWVDEKQMDGWYIASRIFTERIQKAPDDVKIFAWSPPNADDEKAPPRLFHVPYNKKKPLAGVTMRSKHEHDEAMFVLLEKEVKALEVESGQSVDAGKGGKDGNDGIAGGKDGGKGGKDGKEKGGDGKGGKGKGKPSGWMNKAARLVAAVRTEHWKIAGELAEHYNSMNNIAHEVEKVTKRGPDAMREALTWT